MEDGGVESVYYYWVMVDKYILGIGILYGLLEKQLEILFVTLTLGHA